MQCILVNELMTMISGTKNMHFTLEHVYTIAGILEIQKTVCSIKKNSLNKNRMLFCFYMQSIQVKELMTMADPRNKHALHTKNMFIIVISSIAGVLLVHQVKSTQQECKAILILYANGACEPKTMVQDASMHFILESYLELYPHEQLVLQKLEKSLVYQVKYSEQERNDTSLLH